MKLFSLTFILAGSLLLASGCGKPNGVDSNSTNANSLIWMGPLSFAQSGIVVGISVEVCTSPTSGGVECNRSPAAGSAQLLTCSDSSYSACSPLKTNAVPASGEMAGGTSFDVPAGYYKLVVQTITDPGSSPVTSTASFQLKEREILPQLFNVNVSRATAPTAQPPGSP